MRYVLFFSLSLFLFNCSQHNEDTRSPDYHAFQDSVASIIEKHVENNHNPGIVIPVIHKDSIILNKGYGFANFEEKIPVASQTVFNLASVSKPITAVALLELLQQNKIPIHTPVDKILTEWKLPSTEEYEASQVAVERLLNHTAGISLPSAPIIASDSSISGLNNLLNSGDIYIEYEPGNRWHYSGGGYIILQKIIEDLSGKDFADYMDQETFSLYSLNSATFHQDELQNIPQLALPYNGDKIVAPYKVYGSSAGGLHMNMNDFVQYMRLYFENTAPKSAHSLIADNLINRIIGNTVKVNIEGVDNAYYGLGHGVHVNEDGNYILYHSGGNPGYLAYFLVMPGQKNAAAIFANNSASIPLLVELLSFWSSYFDINIQPVY